MGDKYYINEYNKYYNNYYYKQKMKGKNINYNHNGVNSNKEILTLKNTIFYNENIDLKRRKLDSNSSRYINTINNRENKYFHF